MGMPLSLSHLEICLDGSCEKEDKNHEISF